MISIWKNDCEIVLPNETMGNNILEILSPTEDKCECFSGAANDPRNYTHMIDLSEIYPGSDLDTSMTFQSRINISDSVFFTEPNSRFDVEQYVESGDSGTSSRIFGNRIRVLGLQQKRKRYFYL